MEIADALGRSPRETLMTISLAEFNAYAKLGADRSDEVDEAHGDAPGAVDVSEMAPGAIASMFGAEMV
jgi:hypothetical protein